MRQQFMWTKWGLWLVLAAAVTEPVGAADDVWTGGASGRWGRNANWSLGRQPDVSDKAINAAGQVVIVRGGTSPFVVGTLAFDGGLTLQGNGLEIRRAGSFVRQDLTLSGGSLFVDRQLDVGDAAAGTGLVWTSAKGLLDGNGTVRLLGNSIISGRNGGKPLGARLEVAGGLTWSGDDIIGAVAGPGSLYITPDGNWLDAGDKNHKIDVALRSNGVYRKTGDKTTELSRVDNAGRLEVAGGSLHIGRLDGYARADQSLNGGTYSVGKGKLLIDLPGTGNLVKLNTATLEISDAAGRMQVNGANGKTSVFEDLETNRGSILLSGGASEKTLAALANEGSMVLAGAAFKSTGNFTNDAPGTVRLLAGAMTARNFRINGGTLSGIGTLSTRNAFRVLAGTLEPGGRLAPGANLEAGRIDGVEGINGIDGIGTLRIEAGSFEMSGGELDIDIAGKGDGLSDLLQIAGNASLGGTLAVNFTYRPQPLDSFLVLSSTGPLSTFQREVVTGLPGDLEGRVRYFEGNVYVDIVSAVLVPEPATPLLLLAGLGLVAGGAKRRRGRV